MVKELARRNAAISAVTTYCEVEEGGRPRQTQVWESNSALSVVNKAEELALPDARIFREKEKLDKAMRSTFHDKRPTVCFICLGNESLSVDKRTFSFGTSGDLSKHFRRKHLSNLNDDPIACKMCKISLKDKMHLQNHAFRIHGTVS
jgi:hypothetical protein